MIKDVFQCCYTNDSEDVGGRVVSGWKTVACSPDVPPEVLSTCQSVQGGNSAISGIMKDETGTVLNLLEFCGDGSYFYAIRTQYGLLDHMGRANMFSHAYAFPCAQALGDPNVFLTVDRTNFKASKEEAMAPQDTLIRTASLTLSSAMAQAGLTQETYRTLIRCIYAQHQKSDPLYIQYDGTEDQLRAVLYCVYMALPHYLRRTLRVSAAPTSLPTPHDLVFSVRATEMDAHVIPQTGENTVLAPRVEKLMDRQGYVDYAVLHPDQGERFFQNLETLAGEMGDPTGADETVLRLACQTMLRPDPRDYSDEELNAWLLDGLRTQARGNALERQFAAMLTELRRRDRFLDEPLEANLARRLGDTTCAELAQAGKEYNISRFATLPPDEAARRLGSMTEENFSLYSTALSATTQGMAILDFYYEGQLTAAAPSWERVNTVLGASAYLQSRPLTQKTAEEQAWTLYTHALRQPGAAPGALDAYLAVMSVLHPGQDTAQWQNTAKNAYWSAQRLEDFDPLRQEEYNAMGDGSQLHNIFKGLTTCAELLSHGEEIKFLTAVQAFFQSYHTDPDPNSFAGAFSVFHKLIHDHYRGDDPFFIRWARAAAHTPKALLDQLYAVRGALLSHDLDALLAHYQGLYKSACDDSDHQFMREVDIILFNWAPTYDEEETIPLDFWLSVSLSMYGNAFRIFDNLEPRILDEDPEGATSALLQREFFQRDAEDYIAEKGKHAKLVKRWLNNVTAGPARSRQEKKAERAERKAEKALAKEQAREQKEQAREQRREEEGGGRWGGLFGKGKK